MREVGIVTKIEGDTILLECRPSAACHSCKGGVCGAKNRSIRAKNSSKLPLSVGDIAEIYVPSTQAVSSGVRVLGMPILLFVLFFWGAGHFMSNATEGVQVAFGILGMGLGFGSMYFLGNKTSVLPQIVRKLELSNLESLEQEVPEELESPLLFKDHPP
ncbi:MAG: SoxR reducing system RseC family protein [Spirochaetales bacterium]